MLIIDEGYGWCRVERDAGTVVVVECDFDAHEPLVAALAVRGRRMGERTRVSGVVTERWRPFLGDAIGTVAAVESAMIRAGYTADRLAAKAIVHEAVELPNMAGSVRVSEAVERGIGSHLDVALAATGLPLGNATVGFRAHPREARDPRVPSRALPFFVAEALVPAPAGLDVAETRKRLREGLKPVAGSLARADVVVHEGTTHVLIGLRPPAAVLHVFEAAALPAFESSAILGTRTIDLRLEREMTPAAFKALQERAVASTAAVAMEQVEPTRVRLVLPSAIEGYYASDETFRERLNWILAETQSWIPEMTDVGDMELNKGPALAPAGR